LFFGDPGAGGRFLQALHRELVGGFHGR
jgi:hypothetical protein